MANEERAAIRLILEAHNTITLATCCEGKPWAASLFFASDKDLNLYFVSDYRTRHARDIGDGADVVATVNTDCAGWSDVKGLQITGFAEALDGLGRVSALRHYLVKFADVKALFTAPKDKDEETIAQRLKAANMYRLKPRWIRLIDNSKWFGYKREIDCEQE
ncbi:MAG TPA: pyridoxamine 5'-phosphate oxidase family protein [Gammaproteobacteria bacterium]|jgi:hypothetical protein|nr:hypothetical protein [Gammaproteobacteria bacterium]MDP7660611.1 pyridoxamine 5'-phosphate oxidase family protein [Gammaproteobacteria bacterium]HJP39317.1 pyridoxamine 5'-phosphate oxidase family protein [Gammaproteobacteria bacterium]